MSLAVLRLGLVITYLVAGVYSSCLFQKSCPCGQSGKNYTRCYDVAIEQYSCERWINCQTCEDNYEFCKTCPKGRSGPTCKDSACPLLKRPRNGRVKCIGGHKFCAVSCLPGFRFENRQASEEIVLKCEHNVWIPRRNIPDCTPTGEYCDLQGTGNYDCKSDLDGIHCDITCNGKPEGTYHCYPGRGWDSSLPSCVTPKGLPSPQAKKVSCPDPGIPEKGGRMDIKGNAIASQRVFMEGEMVIYFCRGRNGTFERTTYLTCQSDTTWSRNLPECVSSQKEVKVQSEPSCKHPGVFENGIIEDFESDTEQFPVGTELRFVCREGYQRRGPEAIYCVFNLTWSETPPVCAAPTTVPKANPATFCKHPGMVQNGIIENDSPDADHFQAGVALKFRCIDGYELEGPEHLYCRRNGEWSHNPPTCIYISAATASTVSCVHPGMLENGRIDGDMTRSSFSVGTNLLFHCNPGTERQGPMLILCQSDGKWSDNPPTCNPLIDPRNVQEEVLQQPCKHPGTIRNGVNVQSITKSGVYLEGDEIKFICREGFSMEGQDTLYCLSTGEWTGDPPTCRLNRGLPACGRVYQENYKKTGQYTRSDWPWTVGISTVPEDDVEKMFCGGALLNTRTVLTTAHCATSSRNINLHFGHHVSSADGVRMPEQVRNIQISQVFIHPEYDESTHVNDIAVMKLEHRIYYDRRTRSVCLPTPAFDASGENLFPGTKTIVTGYGLHFAPNHSSTAQFLKLEFPLEDEKVCDDVCRGQGLVTCSPSTFCAGRAQNADECVYGGSPLVVFHPGKNLYTLEGLVTRAESTRDRWNGRCKRPESYTTFTNVTHFLPFIMEHF